MKKCILVILSIVFILTGCSSQINNNNLEKLQEAYDSLKSDPAYELFDYNLFNLLEMSDADIQSTFCQRGFTLDISKGFNDYKGFALQYVKDNLFKGIIVKGEENNRSQFIMMTNKVNNTDTLATYEGEVEQEGDDWILSHYIGNGVTLKLLFTENPKLNIEEVVAETKYLEYNKEKDTLRAEIQSLSSENN